MRKGLLLLLLIALSLYPALCRATSVAAEVDRNRIGAGESVQLTVTIEGQDGEVDLSGIGDFDVSPAGTSTNLQIINGQMSRQVSHSYLLLPKKSGRLQIPALTVTVNGNPYRTQPIAIQVGAQGQSGSAPAGEVLLEAEVSNPEPYLGQSLIYTLRILQRVQLANPRLQKPAMERFHVTQIEDGRKSYRVSRSGLSYQATELRFLLTPLQAGPARIGRALLRCDVMTPFQGRRRSPFRSFFSDPFFGDGRLVTKTFRSPAVDLTVKPLPETGRPPSYDGLIGHFTVTAQLDNDHPKVGDSITFSITLQGTGNLKDITPPAVAVPPAFKLYQDSPQEDIQVATDGYSGKKIFRYALVAVQPGSWEIPPVRIDAFDPDRETYVALHTKPFAITVAAADSRQALHAAEGETEASRTTEPKQETVTFLDRDILPLKDDLRALEDHSPIPLSWFLFFWLLPALLVLLVGLYLRVHGKPRSVAERMTARSREAIQEACRLDDSSEQFLTCLHRAIVAAVLAKAGIPGESLTHQEVGEILNGNGGNEELATAALELLQALEGYRYGGRAPDEQTRKKLLEKTRYLTKALQK